MKVMKARVKFLAITAIFLMSCVAMQAQFGKALGKAVENAAKNATIRKAEQKTDQAVSKSIDKVTDPNTYKDDETNDNKDNVTNNNGNDSSSKSAGGGNAAIPPKLESYSQYDFVPGDQILFYEDFSQDAIGDFPAMWSTNTSGEVKTLNNFPGKWFQITANSGVFTYLNDLELPENFILEFDYIPTYSDEAQQSNPGRVNWYASAIVKLYSYGKSHVKEVDDALYPGDMGLRLFFNNFSWSMDGYSSEAEKNGFTPMAMKGSRNYIVSEQINHIIVWVQGRRVRVYHAGAKVMDGPTVLPAGMVFKRLVFTNDHGDNRPFFSNIKITTAAPDVRSKLITEGKLISYGINFDSGKDVIKPESYGAVKAIADVLKDNPNVRVRVIGHTDSDGNADSNLDLSKRRAAAVKSCLSKDFGIDGSRIETDGKGQTEPLAANDTSEGKAKNRRVEFVKI